MLRRNDLLCYAPSAGQAGRTVRLLWISPRQDHAFVIDAEAARAQVEKVAMAMLLADIGDGRSRLLLDDPYRCHDDMDPLPEKYRQMQARAARIVSSLLRHEPDIYDARRRGPLVAQHAQQHGVSHPTVYRYLRRYWQRGQTLQALLPDYRNSGGRGKTRAATAGVKRGRPAKPGHPAGVNADADLRAMFRIAVARYVAAHRDLSWRGAYALMLREFFGTAAHGRQSGAVPSFGQFRYWIGRDGMAAELPRS